VSQLSIGFVRGDIKLNFEVFEQDYELVGHIGGDINCHAEHSLCHTAVTLLQVLFRLFPCFHSVFVTFVFDSLLHCQLVAVEYHDGSDITVDEVFQLLAAVCNKLVDALAIYEVVGAAVRSLMQPKLAKCQIF